MAAPTKTFRFGNVLLSQFENKSTKDGKTFTVVSFNPQKVYNQNGETKYSSSFKPNELFFLIQCCQEAVISYYQKTYKKSETSEKIPF